MAKKSAAAPAPVPAATPPLTALEKPMELPATLLKADPDNARTIEAPALRGLGVSLSTFGDLSGIVWNERTGELVAGHQRMNRLAAAGAAAWMRTSKTEGYIEHPKTGERFHVRIVDWDETTQRMANLTANNPHIQGEFTADAAEQLEALEEEAAFEVLQLGELEKNLAKAADKAAEGSEGAEDQTSEIKDSYAVIIECPTEREQQALLARFLDEGLNCRAVI